MIDPADADQLGSLLRRRRLTLRPRLGQHFLVDPALRDAVAREAGIEASDHVLEVGAGVGTLTVALAPLCRELIAVELDRRLVPALAEVTSGHRNVRIVEADILQIDLRELYPTGGEIVAGNIPYQLTGALIRKLLGTEPSPRRLSLVVQREVAERWTSERAASLATVAVQAFAEAELLLVLPAAAFTPVPRVDSALVRLEVRSHPAVSVPDLDGFFRLVEAVFQFRRKQLRGALARVAAVTPDEAARRLTSLGIDPARRAQTLALVEWERVYSAFALEPPR